MINCCTVDWFDDWPKEALEIIGHKYLDKVDVPKEIKNATVIVCQHFHIDAR